MAPDSDAPDTPASLPDAEDLAAWLLAEDDPYRPPVSGNASTTSATIPFTPQTGAPEAVSSTLRADVEPTSTEWSAVGGAFQPIPGGQLTTRLPPSADHPAGVVVVAGVGATVHAVVPGVVVLGTGSAGGLSLRGDDGMVAYAGTAVVAWTVADGSRVNAGAVLGVVTGCSQPEQGPELHIIIGVTPASDDPVGWLTGLADPAELGTSSAGGLGPDPFLTDLRLGGHLDGMSSP